MASKLSGMKPLAGRLGDSALPGGAAAAEKRKARTMAGLQWGCLAGVLLLAAACSPAPKGDLLNIQEERHKIGNPSRDQAFATGIGCGSSEKTAMTDAQRVAEYNLRSLTGEAHYQVQFTTLRTVPDKAQKCFEVRAQAMPLLQH